MCFFLYVASPLTLSEVRSMLPAGFSADLLAPADGQRLRTLFPAARTTARFLLGHCSCALQLPHGPDAERELRRRYRAMALPRPQVLLALDRHRRSPAGGPPPAERRAELTAFVAEHARNAGATLYLLQFEGTATLAVPVHPVVSVALPEAVRHADGWLIEDTPTVVTRQRAP